MKKIGLWVSILLFVSVILAACSTTQSGIPVQAAAGDGLPTEESLSQDTGGSPEFSFSEDLPLSLKLGMGILKLDGTKDAVDAGQAGQLLVLWKAMRSLSESDTTAVEEMDALTNQIKSAMSPAQLVAIEELELSGQDMLTIFKDLGIEIGAGGGFPGRFSGEVTDEMRATAQAARESGDGPPPGFGRGEGMGLGQGPGGGAFQDMTPEERQAAIEQGGGFRRMNLGVSQVLLEAVIQYLQGLIQ